jgi:predicted ATPase/class 3 adenylate cyclase
VVRVELPTGVVTFVLTDIEGSTRLLRRLGARYDEVLARHIGVIRRSVEQNGGVLVSTTGDSCFAAFDHADAALAACAGAQRDLEAESWPADGRPRVRMGVHTGLASPRDGDYVALAVHQAARVMAAAHGNQVLVSGTAAQALESLATTSMPLRSLGRYRLRDFDEAVQLFCLMTGELDGEVPAVRAMPVDGHNLVAAPTTFVGRDADVEQVAGRIGRGRLVTLTGPGGVGKSRLAISVGLAVARAWDNGVWLVDFAPVQDESLIGSAVASVVGASVDGGSDRWQAAIERLRTQRSLLVLENCEHLTGEIAQAVGELLHECRDVGVLATSREPLGVQGEVVCRVEPLVLPSPTASLEEAARAPAVQLFVDRASALSPGFALDEDNLRTTVDLCRRLDGLPLALELAAAQTAVLSVDDLLSRLDERVGVLRSRSRNVPDRQRTMDAVIEWSYRLLSRPEQAVFRRVGIFRDGFSLDASIAAGADLGDSDVPGVLWSLVDKSLVAVDTTANATRYRLLQTVRTYARHLLDEQDETTATAIRLATWWLDRIGPWRRMDRACSSELELELDNVRELVLVLADSSTNQAQQLACSVGHYFYSVHAPQDGATELSRYAGMLTSTSAARVSLLATLALLHIHSGHMDRARLVLEEAKQVERDSGGPPIWDDVAVERALGEVEIRAGNNAAAAAIARGALERPLTPRARARMSNLLAIASYFLGDTQSAEAAFSEELEMARRLGDEHLMAIAEGNVAELAVRRGDVRTAARHQAACLELGLALGRPVAVALSSIVAARLTAAADPVRAAQLHAKAEAILAESGHQLYDDDLRASGEMLTAVEEALGEERFHAIRDEGRSLTLADAASLAGDALRALSS